MPTGCRKGQRTEYRDAVLVLKALIWDGPSCGDINAKLGLTKTLAGWVKFRALYNSDRFKCLIAVSNIWTPIVLRSRRRSAAWLEHFTAEIAPIAEK